MLPSHLTTLSVLRCLLYVCIYICEMFPFSFLLSLNAPRPPPPVPACLPLPCASVPTHDSASPGIKKSKASSQVHVCLPLRAASSSPWLCFRSLMLRSKQPPAYQRSTCLVPPELRSYELNLKMTPSIFQIMGSQHTRTHTYAHTRMHIHTNKSMQ